MESRLGRLAIRTLFPHHCVSCEEEGDLLCESCSFAQHASVPVACAFCDATGSFRTCSDCQEEVFLDGVSSLGRYADKTLRGLIHHWKYYGDELAESHAHARLRMFLRECALPLHPFFVTHVPLHTSRAGVRGFDQAERIASWVADSLRVPQVHLLERTQSTAPQAQRGVSERAVGLLDDVFTCRVGTDIPKHVLLCDDVFTSGATMDAAARRLKQGGAEVVWGIVLAKGD